jgi:hypothetical protein
MDLDAAKPIFFGACFPKTVYIVMKSCRRGIYGRVTKAAAITCETPHQPGL